MDDLHRDGNRLELVQRVGDGETGGIAIAAMGLTLAGCSSFSFDAFRSTPPSLQLQLDSVPSGADALTSLGPGCKTPCSVAVPVADAA